MQDLYTTYISRAILENERHRWSYMDRDQLLRRLNKITRKEKLSAFYQAAENRSDSKLVEAAYLRYAELFNGGINLSPIKTAAHKKITTPKVKKEEEMVEVNIRRFIDF